MKLNLEEYNLKSLIACLWMSDEGTWSGVIHSNLINQEIEVIKSDRLIIFLAKDTSAVPAPFSS